MVPAFPRSCLLCVSVVKVLPGLHLAGLQQRPAQAGVAVGERACRRVALRPLLRIATLIAVPQVLPLLFIRSPAQAMAAAALIGLLGGFAQAAYLDLYLRSCPKRLEGTTMTLANALVGVAASGSNLLGAWLYARGGFAACVVGTMAAYLAILPVLRFVPAAITAHREGEPAGELSLAPAGS